MAGRQFKQGLDYFPLDVNIFDNKKIQLIEAEFGYKGIMVAIRLLCKIYAHGYFYQWGEEECLLFSRAAGAGFAPGLVSEIVNGLVRRRFFDKGCFDSFGILTSQSIQEIYNEVCERRKCLDIIAEYWLLDVPPNNNANIYSINDNIHAQRKEKESKKKKSVVAESGFFGMDCNIPEDEESDRLRYDSLVEYFNKHTQGVFGNVRMPLNENRKKHLKARIREFGAASFEEMVQTAARSNFLKGDNQRGFKATFDWMIKPSNYQKILEGNYENTKKQTNATNQGNYTTIAERVRSESDALRQQLAAKYGEGETIR